MNNDNNKFNQGSKSQIDANKSIDDRPLKVDEDSYDPLTVARMTDHNVTGMKDDNAAGPRELDNRFNRKKK